MKQDLEAVFEDEEAGLSRVWVTSSRVGRTWAKSAVAEREVLVLGDNPIGSAGPVGGGRQYMYKPIELTCASENAARRELLAFQTVLPCPSAIASLSFPRTLAPIPPSPVPFCVCTGPFPVVSGPLSPLPHLLRRFPSCTAALFGFCQRSLSAAFWTVGLVRRRLPDLFEVVPGVGRVRSGLKRADRRLVGRRAPLFIRAISTRRSGAALGPLA